MVYANIKSKKLWEGYFSLKEKFIMNVVIVYGEIVSKVEFKFIYDRYYKLAKGQNYTESKNKCISETRWQI